MGREELARLALDAVPLALHPVDGFDRDDPEMVEALDPGPSTWEQVCRWWPDVRDGYETIAGAVAAAVRRGEAGRAERLARCVRAENWVDTAPYRELDAAYDEKRAARAGLLPGDLDAPQERP